MRGWRCRLFQAWLNAGLRGRIVVLGLLLGLAPALLLGYLVEHQDTRLLRRQAEDITTASLERTQRMVELYLAQVEAVGQLLVAEGSVAAALDPVTLSTAAAQADARVLAAWRAPLGGWGVRAVVVAGVNGFAYDNGLDGAPTLDALARQPDTAGIVTAAAQAQGHALWTFDATRGDFVWAREIVASGRERGLVILFVSDRALARAMVGQGNGQLVLTDRQGLALVPAGVARPAVDAWASALGRRGAAIVGKDVVARQVIAGTPWTLWRALPLAGTALRMRRAQTDALLILAIAVALTAGLSVWFARRLTRPVDRLVARMAAFEGDGAPPVVEGAPMPGELGRIERSFQAMAHRIQTLIDEVYREQLQRREAEWQALQAQIHPHFLSNTLDSIAWLARQHRVPQIRDMALALSRLLRTSLSPGPGRIPLREELTYVRAYLRIQEIRFDGRMTAQLDVPAALEGLLVPKLLLQPLVENACRHGLEERAGVGRISVRARLDKAQLVIEVEDDGVGMGPDQLRRAREGSASGRVGLANTEQRLRTLYGDQGSCQLFSRPGEGTRVEVRLPAEAAASAV